MRKIPYGLTIAALLLVAQAAFAGAGGLRVVAVPAPLVPYLGEILRGQGKAESLLKPNQDMHDFALAPSQGAMLEHADILVVPDKHLTPWLMGMAARHKGLRVIALSELEGANPLPLPTENPWISALQSPAGKPAAPMLSAAKAGAKTEAKTESKPAALTIDPHLWLDPERMAAMAAPLAEAMATAAPEATVDLRANAATLAQHLRQEVIPALQPMLSATPRTRNALDLPEIPYLTDHAAYRYFYARFGLHDDGALTLMPEDHQGARSLLKTLQQARKQPVRCLIGEQQTSLSKQVAALTGARFVLLQPEQLLEEPTLDARDWMKNDYDRLLYRIAKGFAGCL